MPTDTTFPFTDADAAACDAILEEHRNDLMEALSLWLRKDEELHPERYANGDPEEIASGAAWAFFDQRLEALSLTFDFGGEEGGH